MNSTFLQGSALDGLLFSSYTFYFGDRIQIPDIKYTDGSQIYHSNPYLSLEFQIHLFKSIGHHTCLSHSNLNSAFQECIHCFPSLQPPPPNLTFPCCKKWRCLILLSLPRETWDSSLIPLFITPTFHPGTKSRFSHSFVHPSKLPANIIRVAA